MLPPSDEKISLQIESFSPAAPEKCFVPAYKLNIITDIGNVCGILNLRLGHNETTYFSGNIGYLVYPEYRGHGFAARAVRLSYKFLRSKGMNNIIITCNPSNLPSVRTCEKLEGTLLETARIPEWHDLYHRGQRIVNIYRIEL